jgi:hypothetical protein
MMLGSYKKTILFLFITLIILAGAFQIVIAGDQTKTQEFFVGMSSAQINSATDFSFAMYLGEDLSGVTSPVKSALFTVSGVYTGGGSLELKIDSDSSTSKVFTLPSVSKPTDFQIIYRDANDKLGHTSAGTYTHTVNVSPSGVTISGLGIKLETTHQFAPSSCVDGPTTNQKIKTSEFLVASLTSSINSLTQMPFSIYIGDDISGVSNPIKSIYFVVSGVYTGSGNLDLSLSDGSVGTSTSFYLPSNSSARNFSFIYTDDYDKITPTSAGTFSYILNLTPSGPTVSNLAVKAVMSHRYKPVSCGVGYPPYGDLVSAVFDSTANADGAAYNSIMWKGSLGGASFDQGKVKFQIAAADNAGGPWNYVGGETCGSSDWYEGAANTAIELSCHASVNNKRYFRYKIRLCADDCILGGTETPQVDDVIVNWSP